VWFSVQGQVPQTVSSSGTELRQGETVNNGTTTIVKAAGRYSVSTKILLEDLAFDETFNGTWFAKFTNRVPANAKLEVTFAGPGDFSSLSCQVVSGANAVDVSNVLSAAPSGSNDVHSSTALNANAADQAPFTTTDYHQYTIAYDARGIGGTLHFIITGLATSSTIATKPNAKGFYTETDSFNLADGIGGGIDTTGTAFVLTGITFTASGSAKLGTPAAAAEGPPLGASDGAVPSTGDDFSSGAADEQVSAPRPPVFAERALTVVSANGRTVQAVKSKP